MVGIKHIQKTTCYCCACKKDIVIGEVEIPDGYLPLKYYQDSPAEGWQAFVLDGMRFYVCPKHDLDVVVFIDGERFRY